MRQKSRRSDNRRSRYSNRLVAVIVLLLAVLAVFAVFWLSRDGLSCGTPSPSPATVTLPPSTESTTTTSTASTTTSTTAQAAPLDFDVDEAMQHIKALAQDIGPRRSGTQDEEAALSYCTAYLQSLSYDVHSDQVSLPGGLTSRNLTAVKHGDPDLVIVIGGHIDSKAGAPGGNDNASGVAVVLELARDLRNADVEPTIQFVVFGAEEMTDSDPDHHHYGSRQFVQSLGEEDRGALVGIISVDMVGYGSEFTVRTMEQGPRLLRDMMQSYSTDHGLPARPLKDLGEYGWSDHEPFELAGYPSVWVEWREDPAYHTARDTYSHCDPEDVGRTGKMLLGFLSSLSMPDLDALAAARQM